ncbi:hypothetical protein EFO90_07000 [Lactiplantibacillus plantarum]|uniref:hypothetical protein n=1 Tax=Lactiplantibacillus plantarum TaxID=1590 RepID=UPI0021A5F9F9|nr:hypothetical protein [Lactiplantibacillus plantarum]MCT3214139.1 hypothetical protein [Lactiplantibacillus plantarum]MCT3271721.1 hypothetical protein [Lactiplantibacillus plantarum]
MKYFEINAGRHYALISASNPAQAVSIFAQDFHQTPRADWFTEIPEAQAWWSYTNTGDNPSPATCHSCR